MTIEIKYQHPNSLKFVDIKDYREAIEAKLQSDSPDTQRTLDILSETIEALPRR